MELPNPTEALRQAHALLRDGQHEVALAWIALAAELRAGWSDARPAEPEPAAISVMGYVPGQGMPPTRAQYERARASLRLADGGLRPMNMTPEDFERLRDAFREVIDRFEGLAAITQVRPYVMSPDRGLDDTVVTMRGPDRCRNCGEGIVPILGGGFPIHSVSGERACSKPRGMSPEGDESYIPGPTTYAEPGEGSR